MRCLLLVIVVPGDRQGIGPYSSLGAWQSRPFYFTNAPVPDLCPVEFAHLTNARPYRARTKTGAAPWKHDSGPAAMVGGRDSTSRPLRPDLSPQPLKATYATRCGGSHPGKDRTSGKSLVIKIGQSYVLVYERPTVAASSERHPPCIVAPLVCSVAP